MAEQGSSSDVFRREIANDAISHICDYFDEKGLTLYERWHVCECIARSAEAIMSDNMRQAVANFEDADLSAVEAIASELESARGGPSST